MDPIMWFIRCACLAGPMPLSRIEGVVYSPAFSFVRRRSRIRHAVMRIYQTIHRYDPYIPYFEESYRPKENGYTFQQIIDLLRHDGFFAAHHPQP